MGSITLPYTFIAGQTPTATNWNANPTTIATLVNGQLDKANVDSSSTDGIVTMDETQSITGAKTFSGAVVNTGGVTIKDTDNAAGSIQTNLTLEWDPGDDEQMTDNSSGVGIDFKMPDASDNQTVFASLDVLCIEDNATAEDGEFSFKTVVNASEAEVLTLSGAAATFTIPVTVGVDDTGHDVKFFGATSGKYMLWDEDADSLLVSGDIDMVANGNKIDLDADNDTSIRASADDTISIEVAGADDFTITANSLNVLTGSVIDLADNAPVQFGDADDASIKWDATNLAIAAGSADVKITASNVIPATNDGSALGVSGTAWADLFLASGSVVDFNAGDVTITHASNMLTVGGGDLHVADSFGVVIGHTAQETVSTGDGATDLVPEVQVLGTTAADASMLLAAFSTTATTAGSPILAFAKGGNATIGSHTVVTDGEELGNIIAYGDDGTDLEAVAAQIQFEVDGTPGTGDMPGRIIFSTTADGAETATEHMKLASDGRLFLTKSAGGTNMIITNSASGGDTPYGIAVDFSAASPDNSSAYYLYFEDSTTARFRVNSDGDVLNHDGTYGTISDVKFKEQITSARSYWNDFKRLSYKKFKHKTDVAADGNNAPYRLGLIAQEVESVFPALVPTSPMEGTDDTYKWVKSSVVEGPIMAKVVQELQARVEALES